MPTYEYHCEGCGYEFERFQKMKDDPVSVCPECGESKVVRRISSGGGILFKGPGFYATDYRKGPPPAEKRPDSAKAGGGSDSAGAGGTGGSTGGSGGADGSKGSGGSRSPGGSKGPGGSKDAGGSTA